MKRDYTHVLDCSDGIVTALRRRAWKAGEQRVINVAGGNARTAAEVAKIVRDTIPGADIEIGDDSDAAGRAERQDARFARYYCRQAPAELVAEMAA